MKTAGFQVGTFAFVFFGGVFAAVAVFSAIASSRGWMAGSIALAASIVTAAIAVIVLGAVAMLRRRIAAVERDVRGDLQGIARELVAQLGQVQRAQLELRDKLERAAFDPAKYWRDRAQHYGKLAVGDISRLPEFEAETGADKKDLLPFLRAQLRGDEKRALDFGCGFGRFTHELAELVSEQAIGADATPELLAIAEREKKSSKVSFVQAFGDKLPFPDEHFDVVWMSYVMIHILGDAKERTARELVRVLKRGGLLFMIEGLTVWRTSSPHCEFRPLGWYLETFPFPLRTYSREELKPVSVEELARIEPEYRAANRDLHVVMIGRKP